MTAPMLGAKMGPRIAALVSQATVATKAQSVALDVQRFMHTQDAFFRLIGAEVGGTVGQVYQAIADASEPGSWQRDTFAKLAAPRGQGLSMIGMLAGSTGIQGGIVAVMNNALGPAVQSILEREPTGIIDPSAAASAAARGVIDHGHAAGIAASGGLRGSQFDILYAMAESPPDVAGLLQLLNRNEVDEASALRWLQLAGMSHAGSTAMLNLRHQLLSPADLANMVVQDVLPQGEASTVANRSGVSDTDFDHLVRVTGLPPGPMDGLVMLRRGIIDESRFATLVRQGHTKPEYIEPLLRLREAILSPSDAAQMVVQGFLPHGEGRARAGLQGVPGGDFDLMVEVHGRPISPTEATTLLNRGEIGKAEFAQIVAESDVKTKYTDELFKLRRHLPSLYEVRQLVAGGAITDEEAIQIVVDGGYDHSIAAGIVAAAHKTKTAKSHDLALGEILTLWEGGYLQESDARTMLGQLGYDDSEVQLLLDTVEARRLRSYLDAAVATVRARYVNHQTIIDQASTALDGLGVPPKARDQALDLWTRQREANVRTLSEAQIAAAVKKGLIAPDIGEAKLVQLGYSPDDAAILIGLTGTTTLPAA